jgi:RNA polymerase sigma-70 factor (ECF subfamily)
MKRISPPLANDGSNRKADPFPSTAWPLLERTRGSGSEARVATAQLFCRYERSVLALLRSKQLPPGDSAEDLKQLFFEQAITRNDFAKIEPAKGRFRCWLSRSISNLVCTRWKHWHAAKRGNGVTSSLDFDVEEPLTPDYIFERNFAEDTIEHTLTQLRDNIQDKAMFDKAKRFLPGRELDLEDLRSFAASIDKEPATVSVFIHRMREKFKFQLHKAVAETLDLDPMAPASQSAVAAELARMGDLLCRSRDPFNAPSST